MLLWCSLAVPKLPSTYNRTHGTHNDFGGANFKGLASNYLLLMTLPPYFPYMYTNFRKDLEFCILVESYVDSRSQNVCSFFTAGWAFGFLRAVGFSSSQFLRYEPETSGIDVTLLGVNNHIRGKAISNGIMPN